MTIERVREMPNRYTFRMKAVSALLTREMSGKWGDPFCGRYSPAFLRNDAMREMRRIFISTDLSFSNHWTTRV